MATFNFNCPQCGNLLAGEDEWRGMETECPYCKKAIIIPTNIVIKKANIVKRSVTYLKSHPIVLFSIIVFWAVIGGVAWWLYEEDCEENACWAHMYELAKVLKGTDEFAIINKDTQVQICPSGKPYQYNFEFGEVIPMYNINPNAVIIECPKHKNNVLVRASERRLEYTIPDDPKEIDRTIPLFNNSPARKKAIAFLESHNKKIYGGDPDIRLDIRTMLYWQGLIDVDPDTRKEVIHILRLRGKYKSEWKWIYGLKGLENNSYY